MLVQLERVTPVRANPELKKTWSAVTRILPNTFFKYHIKSNHILSCFITDIDIYR